MKNFSWLALSQYWLYCGGLEPSPQDLRGMPVYERGNKGLGRLICSRLPLENGKLGFNPCRLVPKCKLLSTVLYWKASRKSRILGQGVDPKKGRKRFRGQRICISHKCPALPSYRFSSDDLPSNHISKQADCSPKVLKPCSFHKNTKFLAPFQLEWEQGIGFRPMRRGQKSCTLSESGHKTLCVSHSFPPIQVAGSEGLQYSSTTWWESLHPCIVALRGALWRLPHLHWAVIKWETNLYFVPYWYLGVTCYSFLNFDYY